MASDRPTGTVTFLFTDIEGSTRAWEREPDAMARAVAAHDDILRHVIEASEGHVFALGGDSFAAAFTSVDDAVEAARSAQRELESHAWPTAEPIRVRMGIHTGVAEERAGNYFGPTVNRAARIMSAGHGGQVLLSEASASLLGAHDGVHRLGERRLAGVDDSVVIHQLGDDPFPPLRAVRVFTCDVPVARTELIGREGELSRIDRAIETERVLTLVGVGGTGKTRLAFEAARAAQARFEAGVRLVDLAAVSAPGEVADAIATAVETGGADALAAAAAAIGQRQTLLVVDNCEHVIDAVADCLDELLSACPRLKVLATSREPLEIEGEAVSPVPPLDPGGAAADLFRARVAATGVDPDQFDHESVARLCQRLDGLPLAVELAAGRARTLTPDELVERLDEGADLETGRRRRRRRHDALESTIAWSYDLLDEDEQRVLRRASLFEAEFVIRGVEHVTGLSTDRSVAAVDGLVAKSLVVRVPGDTGETSHYRLLETIRDFAARRLEIDDDPSAARDGLAGYMVGLYDAWATGESRTSLLDEFALQRGTIATAARHADATDRLDVLGRILQLWSLVWLSNGARTSEPEEVVGPERISDLPVDVRGELALARAVRCLNRGDAPGCGSALEEAFSLSADRETSYRAAALSIQSRLVAYVDPEAALDIAERAWAMQSRVVHDPTTSLIGGEALWMWQLQDYANVLAASGRNEAAWDMLVDALDRGPEVNPIAHGHVLGDVVWMSLLIERPDEGLAAVAAAPEAARRSHDGGMALGVIALAHATAAAASGDPTGAQRRLLSTLETWDREKSEAPVRWSVCIVALGVTAFHAGDLDRSRRLLDRPLRTGMAALMLRRQYLSRLGVPPTSAAPLADLADADVDTDQLRELVEAEMQHLRVVLTDSWDAVASGWAARHDDNERHREVPTTWLVERIDPEPGQVILDLAAGAGAMAHRIAERVAPGGRVIVADVAPSMVEMARRAGRERGIDNVEYRVFDAERMTLEQDSVDAVVCRQAYMVMADPRAALRETRRVLRPGGSLAFSVFTTPGENPWVAVPGRTFIERGHIVPPELGPPGPFSMGDRNLLHTWVTEAGFDEIDMQEIDFEFAWTDEDDAWQVVATQNTLLSRVVHTLDRTELEATRRAVFEGFAPYRTPSGAFRVPARTWVVHAR